MRGDHKSESLAASWGSRDAADEGRRRNEKEAFNKLVEDLVVSWPRLLERHVKRG